MASLATGPPPGRGRLGKTRWCLFAAENLLLVEDIANNFEIKERQSVIIGIKHNFGRRNHTNRQYEYM